MNEIFKLRTLIGLVNIEKKSKSSQTEVSFWLKSNMKLKINNKKRLVMVILFSKQTVKPRYITKIKKYILFYDSYQKQNYIHQEAKQTEP